VCGAEYGARSPERSNRRNGYRHRDLDTRVGTVDVAVPKLREGSFFPDWLLQRRRRAEAALTTVVATCYVTGASGRPTRLPSSHQRTTPSRRLEGVRTPLMTGALPRQEG
jgi:transposase-like protein